MRHHGLLGLKTCWGCMFLVTKPNPKHIRATMDRLGFIMPKQVDLDGMIILPTVFVLTCSIIVMFFQPVVTIQIPSFVMLSGYTRTNTFILRT